MIRKRWNEIIATYSIEDIIIPVNMQCDESAVSCPWRFAYSTISSLIKMYILSVKDKSTVKNISNIYDQK